MRTGGNSYFPIAEIWCCLKKVQDPEVPVLSVVDLGIVRDVSWESCGDEAWLRVVLTPTHFGCPAMENIARDIRAALADKGIQKVKLETQLSPAWSTDCMSDSGKRKLVASGISPPKYKVIEIAAMEPWEQVIPCPRCGSEETTLNSYYGATACKALYVCIACKEPFEHFKSY